MSPNSHKGKYSAETIPGLLKAANRCIIVAHRNRKPLTGNNDYAQKFLLLKAKSILLLKNLQQQLAEIDVKEVHDAEIELKSLLETFFLPTTTERQEIQKNIIYVYKLKIEPVLIGKRPILPIGSLFSLEIISETRDYLYAIGKQANGCYENEWFDACAVMMRRLLESLIIECFESYKIADSIKGKDGNFLYLKELINHFLSETKWNPSRTVKTALPRLKEIGDLSAHSRYYTAKKQDISIVQNDLRIVVQELISIAKIKKIF